MNLQLDMTQTLSLAVVVLLLGRFIKMKFNLLERYCIPEPVIGGIIFALIILIFRQSNILTLKMDSTFQSFFMNIFFTSIGFTASLKLLKNGGLQVLIFLGISILLIISQNTLGLILAQLFNINPLIGLSTGSVPMIGGHGTSGAFGPIFEAAGATGATTVAIASATFGLIMGSIIGGPIAKALIERNKLHVHSTGVDLFHANEGFTETKETIGKLVPNNFMNATIELCIALGIGNIISLLLEKTGMTFPSYIGGMFAAALIRNISDISNLYKIFDEEISVLGNIALSLFLAMALMNLELWLLADLALPLIIMLLAQSLLVGFFAYFITFNLMGKDYEAAVMSAANCGFGMGATPNAMANMEAVTKKYGPAPKAFFIVPLVGSLFIDFFNSLIITIFVNFLSK